MQGIALGAMVQGIEVENRAYAGGWWDWLTPFSLLTGLALVVGYILLGATWLMMKTEGALQEQMQRYAWGRRHRDAGAPSGHQRDHPVPRAAVSGIAGSTCRPCLWTATRAAA
jgi:hypothetical protein